VRENVFNSNEHTIINKKITQSTNNSIILNKIT
jgi:hypothetical protein